MFKAFNNNELSVYVVDCLNQKMHSLIMQVLGEAYQVLSDPNRDQHMLLMEKQEY
jgi:hypothetical protein